jgi:hypothetical protein
MRCEQCGRDMNNAELWQLATDPKAPTSWSMRQLCWDCRQHPEKAPEKASQQKMEAGDADGSAMPKSLRQDSTDYDGYDVTLPPL